MQPTQWRARRLRVTPRTQLQKVCLFRGEARSVDEICMLELKKEGRRLVACCKRTPHCEEQGEREEDKTGYVRRVVKEQNPCLCMYE